MTNPISEKVRAVAPRIMTMALLKLRNNTIVGKINKDENDAQSSRDDNVEVMGHSVPLSFYKRTSFTMDEKNLDEVQRGSLPLHASSCVTALGNSMDENVIKLYEDKHGKIEGDAEEFLTNGEGKDFIVSAVRHPKYESELGNLYLAYTDSVSNIRLLLEVEKKENKDDYVFAFYVLHGATVLDEPFEEKKAA